MKYQAPEGVSGISVGGEQFNVDEKGQIETPDSGDYHSLVAPHGFTPVPAEAAAGKSETAAEKKAREKAEKAAAAEAAEAEAKAKAEAEAAAGKSE